MERGGGGGNGTPLPHSVTPNYSFTVKKFLHAYIHTKINKVCDNNHTVF